MFSKSLLLWASNTGEMRNRQAICVHKYTNRLHMSETMTLWGCMGLSNNNGVFSNEIETKRGYLIFPCHGFGVHIKYNSDVMHCYLSDTYHVARRSRNKYNLSKFHGPR